MLIMFVILLFSMLSIINYIRKKDILSPSFIWGFVWTIYSFLFFVFSSINHIFYPISFNTYAIYFIGALMFSVGESIGDIFNIAKYKERFKVDEDLEVKLRIYKKERLYMFITLFVLIASLPLYYKNVVGISGASILNIKTFFWQVRRASLDAQGGNFSIINNLVPLSIILSVYFYNIYLRNKQNKVLVFLIILVTIVYQLLTGGRSGAVYVILALMGVEVIRERKIKFKSFIKLGIPLLFVIIFIAYFVGKGQVDKSQTFLQNIDAFYKDIVIYLLGGMAAFDTVVKYPRLITSNGGVKRFFLQTAKSLGFNINVPSLHYQFIPIGPGIISNVYTIYSYYYIDYGIIGICFFMILLGIFSSFIYKKAKKGSDFYCTIYGFLVSGIILSVFSEYFYTNLNFLIKATIIILMLEFFKKLRLTTSNESYKEKRRR